MAGEYSVPCQRCDKRNAVSRRIRSTREASVFAAATNRSAEDVRLCSSCLATVTSLIVQVARAKKREKFAPCGCAKIGGGTLHLPECQFKPRAAALEAPPPTPTCDCGDVEDEHEAGGGKCLVEGCRCLCFDDVTRRNDESVE